MTKEERKILIQGARKLKGLRQRELAESVGISRSYYGGIESGHKTPSLKVASLLSEILGISPKFFL